MCNVRSKGVRNRMAFRGWKVVNRYNESWYPPGLRRWWNNNPYVRGECLVYKSGTVVHSPSGPGIFGFINKADAKRMVKGVLGSAKIIAISVPSHSYVRLNKGRKVREFAASRVRVLKRQGS